MSPRVRIFPALPREEFILQDGCTAMVATFRTFAVCPYVRQVAGNNGSIVGGFAESSACGAPLEARHEGVMAG
jgi:hypothetical protein